MKTNNKKEKLKVYVSEKKKKERKKLMLKIFLFPTFRKKRKRKRKKLMLKIFLFPSVVHVFCIAQKIPIFSAPAALETIVTVK